MRISFPFAVLLMVSNAFAENPLQKCPSSPNCVSSLADEEAEHRVEPFAFKGDLEKSKVQLLQAIQGMERSKVVSQAADYLKCEFTSKWLGFVDDVEFYFDPKAGAIHVRSASRVGYSDLGVNRKRVEALRKVY